jgi:autotransporter-associated beta strand protein
MNRVVREEMKGVVVQNMIQGRYGRQFALAMMLAPLLFSSTAVAQGMFSQSGALGNGNLDTSVGLSSSKTYLNAVNMSGGSGTLTINGVVFSNTSGFNPSGSTWSTSGLGAVASGGDAIGGSLGTLLNSLNHNPSAPAGAIETFTLSGLTVGQTYVMTFYSKSWDNAGLRMQDATSSSGASLISYDQDIGGKPNANLVRYTFTASNTTESVSFAQRVYNYSMHQYGFTTEHLFTNAWASGADWTTATWGTPGVPNAAGANANLLAQGAPTALNLDAPVTVGHIQLAGANAWTVSGSNTLTLKADVGGVSVLSTPSGTHTLATALALSNAVLKTGIGTLVLSGSATGSKALNIGAGTVKLSGNVISTATTNAFTSDANSGIGTANLRYGTNGYNLALAFYQGSNLTVNGVTFTNTGTAASGSSGPISWSLANWEKTTTTASFPSGFQPALGQQTYALLNRFYYGLGSNTQTLTLTGLTPGQAYDARVYYRYWGSTLGGRVSNWTFDPGTGTFTKLSNLSEDSNYNGNYIDFPYVAGPDGKLILSAANTSAASWHLYGFSNQQIPTALPATAPVLIGSNGALDLNGGNQTIASLSDFNGSGGLVTNSAATTPVFLMVNQITTNTFSGILADNGTNNAISIFKSGAGPLRLANTNSSYSGVTMLAGGTLSVASLANYGFNSSLGNRPSGSDSSDSVGILFRGGTLQYTNSTPQSTDRAIRLSTTGGGGTIDASGNVPSATLSFTRTNSSPNFWEWPGARTLTLTGSNIGDNTFAMPIDDSGTTVHLTKSGTGKWVLASTNSTYVGVTTLSGGILNLANLSNYGVPGSLGKRTLASENAGGLGEIGILFRGGTLQYTGSTPQSTDRAIRLSVTGGGGTIDASGSDPSATLSFTKPASPNLWETGGNRTLTLTGSNTGSNTFAMVIGDIVGTTTTALKKDGVGMWILSGTNTFLGGTTVQAGRLEVVGGATLGTGDVTVNGGTLRLAGTAEAIADAKRLTLGSSATVQLDTNETVNEFYLNGVQQYRGTWGSMSSSAFMKDPHFTGTGVLRVLSGQPYPGCMIKFF